MPEFTTVAKTTDIPLGEGRAYAVAGRMVAVFHTAEGFHAIDDFCPHMGASLAGGYVEDGMVACPWHAWRFSLNDGAWCDNPRLKVDCFELRVEGDEVQVAVAAQQTPGTASSETPPEEDRPENASG